jgi:hypothetical protein
MIRSLAPAKSQGDVNGAGQPVLTRRVGTKHSLEETLKEIYAGPSGPAFVECEISPDTVSSACLRFGEKLDRTKTAAATS